MKIFVVGASGETGKLLVEQLLNSGQTVKIMVRSKRNIAESWSNDSRITIITNDITQIRVDEMTEHIADCQAIASCLGHNPTLKGIYGKPRKLVTNATQLLGEAILKNKPKKPIKLVLMNSAGNSNRDLDEKISVGQKIVIALLRLLVPPHSDNEKASDYLRINIGQRNPYLEWAVVRPVNLTNEDIETKYSVYASPKYSAIFKLSQVSRINVGSFMANLIVDDNVWNQWKGQMPVIYNDVN